MPNCYIITVRPEVYIDYEIQAESEEEAWRKYHNNEYENKEEDFPGFTLDVRINSLKPKS